MQTRSGQAALPLSGETERRKRQPLELMGEFEVMDTSWHARSC